MSASAEEEATDALLDSLRVHALRVSTARGQMATLQPDLLVLVGTLLASLGDFLQLTCTCTAIRNALAPHRRLVVAGFATGFEPHSSPEMCCARRMLGIPPYVSFEGAVTAGDLMRLSRLFRDPQLVLRAHLRYLAEHMHRDLVALSNRVRELVGLSEMAQFAVVEYNDLWWANHRAHKTRHVLLLRHAKMCSILTEHRFRFKTSLRTLGTFHDRDSQARWRALLREIRNSRRS